MDEFAVHSRNGIKQVHLLDFEQYWSGIVRYIGD